MRGQPFAASLGKARLRPCRHCSFCRTGRAARSKLLPAPPIAPLVLPRALADLVAQRPDALAPPSLIILASGAKALEHFSPSRAND